MRTRVYKTMKGYLKATGYNYMDARTFFGGKRYCYNSNTSWYAVPSKELRAEVAAAFEKHHWTKSKKCRLEALSNGCGADFSFLQCFYVTHKKTYGYCYGNSLSGDAYDYCKRMFTKSAY